MVKRAQLTYQALIWIFRIFFVVVLAFSVFLLVRTYVKTTVDISGTEADLFFQRLIYSKNGLSYFDKESGRLLPGTIDLDKFNSKDFEAGLEKAINYGQVTDHIGAKIYVTDDKANKEYSKYYNKDFFDEKSILAKAGLTKGVGGAKIITRQVDCFIMQDGQRSTGTLKAEIVIING